MAHVSASAGTPRGTVTPATSQGTSQGTTTAGPVPAPPAPAPSLASVGTTQGTQPVPAAVTLPSTTGSIVAMPALVTQGTHATAGSSSSSPRAALVSHGLPGSVSPAVGSMPPAPPGVHSPRHGGGLESMPRSRRQAGGTLGSAASIRSGMSRGSSSSGPRMGGGAHGCAGGLGPQEQPAPAEWPWFEGSGPVSARWPKVGATLARHLALRLSLPGGRPPWDTDFPTEPSGASQEAAAALEQDPQLEAEQLLSRSWRDASRRASLLQAVVDKDRPVWDDSGLGGAAGLLAGARVAPPQDPLALASMRALAAGEQGGTGDECGLGGGASVLAGPRAVTGSAIGGLSTAAELGLPAAVMLEVGSRLGMGVGLGQGAEGQQGEGMPSGGAWASHSSHHGGAAEPSLPAPAVHPASASSSSSSSSSSSLSSSSLSSSMAGMGGGMGGGTGASAGASVPGPVPWTQSTATAAPIGTAPAFGVGGGGLQQQQGANGPHVGLPQAGQPAAAPVALLAPASAPLLHRPSMQQPQ